MITESMNSTSPVVQTPPQASEKIDASRKVAQKNPDQAEADAGATAKNTVAPEEILSKIKSLADNGMFSVRFEKDTKTDQLVVKIVDSTTHEVIRQIPAEAMLGLKKALDDLTGNIVNTTR